MLLTLLTIAVRQLAARLLAARLLAQDAPPVSPWLLGIIAILLIAAFVWLLLRWQYHQPEGDVAARASADAAKTDAVPAKVDMPVVRNEVTVGPDEALPAAESAMATPAIEAVQSYATPEPPASAASAAAAAPQAIDDLEIIEGIGPKIAAVLKQAGITSFNQLAEMEPARISEILQAANLRLADPQSWPEQARLAAAGDNAGLQALQDRLKGGRLQ